MPALAEAMLSTNAGSWNSTGPAGGGPVRVRVTELPWLLMVSPTWCPSVVGKLATEMVFPPLSHGVRHAAADDQVAVGPLRGDGESSSTLLALAMPQACGEEPLPALRVGSDPR